MHSEPGADISTAEFQRISQSYVELRAAERRLLAEGNILRRAAHDLRESRDRYDDLYSALQAAIQKWRDYANVPTLEAQPLEPERDPEPPAPESGVGA
jgi:hypothetical protein